MRRAILQAINAERQRQAKLWNRKHAYGFGDCSWPLDNTVKASVLTEECGEVARAVLEQKDEDLKRELIQVAAVAVAWLESWK